MGAKVGRQAALSVVVLGTALSNGTALLAQAPATLETAQSVVNNTCQRCHNDRARYGNMSLEGFSVANAHERPEFGEAMIRKLRAGLMPPAGTTRPTDAALANLATALETGLDAAAAINRLGLGAMRCGEK